MSKGWITAADIAENGMVRDNIFLLDVRTQVEFRETHIPGATNVPLDETEHLAEVPTLAGDRSLVIVCHHWIRAPVVREQLKKAGVEHLEILKGGMIAWRRQGLPVQGSPGSMPLYRQVRVLAGFLVVIGVLLGAFVHPWLLVLPGLVGARLMYSGLTDRGHVESVLARLPFNRS